MTAGRRVLLPAGFLALAFLLAHGTARGQQREGSHELWQQNLTPEQVKTALARLGAGDFGGPDPFREMVRDYVLKNNPGLANNPELRRAIEKLTGDPEFMRQVKEAAKQRQKDPGRPGQPFPEDFARAAAEAFKNGKAPKLPEGLKGFELPKTEPGGSAPQARPGPGVGQKGEPPVPPKPGDEPKTEPPMAPALPNPGPPAAQNPADEKGNINLDQNPFPPPEEPTDPRSKSLEAFRAIWERNVGPLDETPEVKRALFELIGDNGFDFDLKDGSGNSIWDLLKNGDGTGSEFGDILNGTGGGNWSLGNWEMPKLNNWFNWGGGSSVGSGRSSSSGWNLFGSRRPSAPSGPSSGWGWGGGGGIGGIGGAWLPFVLLLLAVVAVFVWFQLKNLKAREAAVAFAGGGLGPWPVDPRSINTREDVVKAFEYLSVLICGPSAKNWTHGTIAAALADLAATHEETALMLARLYELARYAPLNEPLTAAELVEARKLVCALAGVSY
jgi:hypothetical protein